MNIYVPSKEIPASGVGRGFPRDGAGISSSPKPPRRSTSCTGGAGFFAETTGVGVGCVAERVVLEDGELTGREDDGLGDGVAS